MQKIQQFNNYTDWDTVIASQGERSILLTLTHDSETGSYHAVLRDTETDWYAEISTIPVETAMLMIKDPR